jgi:hypothetical protein
VRFGQGEIAQSLNPKVEMLRRNVAQQAIQNLVGNRMVAVSKQPNKKLIIDWIDKIESKELIPCGRAGDTESHPQVNPEDGFVDDFAGLLRPTMRGVRLEHENAQQRNCQ